ncbi:MAG: CbiX/SirB N-terminal domain-containing protein, partial [Bdellovibrionota bacterium]
MFSGRYFTRLLALVVGVSFLAACANSWPGERCRNAAACSGERPSRTGFLFLAPDRGFLGNEEVQDAFRAAAEGANAELVYVTDERTKESLDRALKLLADRGAGEVTVVPFFLSAHHPKLELAKSLLEKKAEGRTGPFSFARPFSESYF